jgi:hypothetical protein
MTSTQECAKLVAISIAQYDERSDKVCAGFRTPRPGSMAGDAFRNVGCFPAIRSSRIDELFVAGTGLSEEWTRN